MDIRSEAHNGLFQRWKSARTTLTRAISDYLAASDGIIEALSSSKGPSSVRYSLEQTLAGIDLELSSLQSEEEKLKQTRTALANERNKSRVLSPVHRLPREVLVMIFVIATSRYTKDDHTTRCHRARFSPTILASVSSSWRQIALGTPCLWSYIDLIVGNLSRPSHRKQVELWVERSCTALLYVDISEYNYRSDRDTSPSSGTTHLLELLAPLMHRVLALDMGAELGERDLLSPVLALWAKHASTGVEKTLQVFNDSHNNSNAILGPAGDGSFSANDFNSFFRSFNRLAVYNCRISENVMFHEGLVDLQLQKLGHPLTQEKLVAMLATTPRLRTLALANCWIEPSEEIPAPVALNHLLFLSLESDSHSSNLVHVFPLLAIGSEGLSMSLTLENNPDLIAGARAFLGRTKVTRLHAWGIDENAPLSAILCPIPHLKTLALDYFDISGEIPQGFFGLNDNGHSRAPWPRLRTLYLKDPSIEMSCLQQLVQLLSPLKELCIYRPKYGGQMEGSMTGAEWDYLARSMHMVEDFKVEFDWGSRTIGTWDFVILHPY
ncbi:hypothetical protein FRC08_018300 [Ceratobasidium sp. 394]|nr:hypothetical protein FRC08_018300 [Ceratobasidium sp. 394]